MHTQKIYTIPLLSAYYHQNHTDKMDTWSNYPESRDILENKDGARV